MLCNKLWLSTAALFLTVCSPAATLSDNLSASTDYTELINGSTFITAGFQTDHSNYLLTSVTTLIQQDTAGTLSLGLYSNVAQPSANDLGNQPGTFIGSLTSSGSYPSALSPVTFLGNNLPLSPDTTYWLVMSAPTSGSYEWAYAGDNTGVGVGFYPSWGISTDAGQSWYTSDLQPMQMSVTADPVSSTPEPGISSLLLVGLLLVSVKRFKPFSH